MANLIIFGAGDIARLACHYFKVDSEHKVSAFTVDPEYLRETTLLGLPVVEFSEALSHYPPTAFQMFVALSYTKMNQVRAEKFHAMKRLGYRLVSYVSSRCTWLTDHPIGDNCMILEDNTIQPFVKIGDNVILWSGNHVGHDSVIEDHCFITSHVVISGRVRVGAYSFLGVNSTLRDGIRIAPRTLVGGGAVIMKDTIESGVYVANRATKLSRSSNLISP